MIDTDETQEAAPFDLARASRIEIALSAAKTNGVNQSEIADKCGISPQAVYRWKKTGQISIKHLVKLSELSGISQEWIINGEGSQRDALKPERREIVTVPLISSIAAGQMCESPDLYQPGDAEQWIETTARVSARSYALRVSGDSMTNPHGLPSIPEGSIVIVDPETEPMPGKVVVVKIKGENEATLKRLVKDGSQYYLKPLNPAYPIFPLTEQHIVCGVAKQVIQEI